MRHFRAVAHGDADIRKAQRRRIVDAVADHRDDIAGASQILNDAGLVGRQHVGELASETETPSDGAGDDLVVAGQHDAFLYSESGKVLDDGSALQPYLIGVRREPSELPVDSDMQTRDAALVERRAVDRRDVDAD